MRCGSGTRRPAKPSIARRGSHFARNSTRETCRRPRAGPRRRLCERAEEAGPVFHRSGGAHRCRVSATCSRSGRPPGRTAKGTSTTTLWQRFQRRRREHLLFLPANAATAERDAEFPGERPTRRRALLVEGREGRTPPTWRRRRAAPAHDRRRSGTRSVRCPAERGPRARATAARRGEEGNATRHPEGVEPGSAGPGQEPIPSSRRRQFERQGGEGPRRPGGTKGRPRRPRAQRRNSGVSGPTLRAQAPWQGGA